MGSPTKVGILKSRPAARADADRRGRRLFGGTLVALSYLGVNRVVPNYNVSQRAPVGEQADIIDVGFAFHATSYARRLTGSISYVDGGVNIMA
jgi:enoyl-[acyl-carrier-protein] reductase (NADH)